jgi:DNA-binding NtrC family response regulator
MKLKNKNNAAGKPKRVFLVDPFSIVRLAIAEFLNRTPDLAVCGDAATATKALKSIRQLKPDIVLTEILGPQDLEFIQTIHQQHPRLPILVFSFRDHAWYAPRALRAGADIYLPKGVSVDKLVDGIRRALDRRAASSPNTRYQLPVKWCAADGWSRRGEITIAGVVRKGREDMRRTRAKQPQVRGSPPKNELTG